MNKTKSFIVVIILLLVGMFFTVDYILSDYYVYSTQVLNIEDTKKVVVFSDSLDKGNNSTVVYDKADFINSNVIITTLINNKLHRIDYNTLPLLHVKDSIKVIFVKGKLTSIVYDKKIIKIKPYVR